MRQHICKACGKIYLTAKPGSTCCPACAEEIQRNVYRNKVCATCGVEFVGYPASKYCPQCREEARRATSRNHKRTGPARPLGSTDLCQACGQPYTVNAGRQRFCPACAESEVRKNVLASKRAHAAAHRDEYSAQKKADRQDRRVCAVCGKPFSSPTPTVTCSPECAAENLRRRQVRADINRGKAAPERLFGPAPHPNPQSGVAGITWNKNAGRWQLVLKSKYIGLFDTIEAVLAAKEAILAQNEPEKET